SASRTVERLHDEHDRGRSPRSPIGRWTPRGAAHGQAPRCDRVPGGPGPHEVHHTGGAARADPCCPGRMHDLSRILFRGIVPVLMLAGCGDDGGGAGGSGAGGDGPAGSTTSSSTSDASTSTGSTGTGSTGTGAQGG